jgi:hypothetical protein
VRDRCPATVVLALAALAAAGGGAEVVAAEAFPGGPGVSIAAGLPAGSEPSGAAWHPRLGKLLVVDDSGRLLTMEADGSKVAVFRVPGDLEGITVADPASPFVYVGVEHPMQVLEVDVATGRVARGFALAIEHPTNEGLEALAFVPDTGDPEGGLFYAGMQHDGTIHVLRLSIRTSATATTVEPVRVMRPVARADLAALDYDPGSGLLYVAYDTANLLRVVGPDGAAVAEWELPGNDQEGIALGAGRLFVAQDDGGLMSYPFEPPKPR